LLVLSLEGPPLLRYGTLAQVWKRKKNGSKATALQKFLLDANLADQAENFVLWDVVERPQVIFFKALA
jgi:hypothetical protein